MKFRMLGKTGLNVSVMGFGGIPIQRISAEEAVKVVHQALDAGINFFDTARNYTDSEEKLGAAFHGRRDEAIIATKSMARSKKGMAEDIRRSAKLFGAQYIDLYQMHNVKTAEDLDKVLAPGGALEALQEAKREGLVKHIGITGHIKDILIKALRTQLLETVQVPFNAVETDGAAELFRLAQDTNTGVIIMKPLAGGAFSNAQAALKYILSHPVTTVIPGMDSVQQARENAGIGTGDYQLSDEESKLLQGEVARLGQAFCRRCEYCQPCPAGVNIPAMFLLEGYYDRYNLQQWAIERYAAVDVKADACEDCGVCEEKCPYDLPIREMLPRLHGKLAAK